MIRIDRKSVFGIVSALAVALAVGLHASPADASLFGDDDSSEEESSQEKSSNDDSTDGAEEGESDEGASTKDESSKQGAKADSEKQSNASDGDAGSSKSKKSKNRSDSGGDSTSSASAEWARVPLQIPSGLGGTGLGGYLGIVVGLSLTPDGTGLGVTAVWAGAAAGMFILAPLGVYLTGSALGGMGEIGWTYVGGAIGVGASIPLMLESSLLGLYMMPIFISVGTMLGYEISHGAKAYEAKSASNGGATGVQLYPTVAPAGRQGENAVFGIGGRF